MERTLVLLKPDCVQRRLVGRVVTRLEEKGFNVIAMKLMRVTPKLARRHYAEHVEKDWYPNLEKFITGGPLVAAIDAYQADHDGSPPPALQALAPRYLPAVPGTGVRNEPDFSYQISDSKPRF